jgi:cellulose synthase/poly-beta-1,6-N-acetylglucosamine synthase-like glycosyltransferase
MSLRNIAVAIPARNEQERIRRCLERLHRLAPDSRVGRISLVLLANNCDDETAALAKSWARASGASLDCMEVELAPNCANAGWARRLALDAAADSLSDPSDALLCTDADTLVEPDWLSRTLDHLDLGYDAVAGYARLCPKELRRLPAAHRARLSRIRRYELAFDYLRGHWTHEEPWPRHFYEGGASIALTLESYRAIGGAPTPPVGEDKALFAALRAAGKRVRHPRDVKVYTSCRLDGRAPGGAADTLARWGLQDEDEGLWGLRRLAAMFDDESGSAPLSLAQLETETTFARRLVEILRRADRRLRAPDQPARRQTSSR